MKLCDFYQGEDYTLVPNIVPTKSHRRHFWCDHTVDGLNGRELRRLRAKQNRRKSKKARKINLFSSH